MNDEQLIWEAYQKQLKENMESKPWNQRLQLNNGVTLTSLTPDLSWEYLHEVWQKMQDELKNQKGGFMPPDDPREYVDPPFASDADIDDYLKGYYGFSLEELKSLSNAPQFNEEDGDNLPKQIMDTVIHIVEHEMFIGDDSPSPDEEDRLRGRF